MGVKVLMVMGRFDWNQALLSLIGIWQNGLCRLSLFLALPQKICLGPLNQDWINLCYVMMKNTNIVKGKKETKNGPSLKMVISETQKKAFGCLWWKMEEKRGCGLRGQSCMKSKQVLYLVVCWLKSQISEIKAKTKSLLGFRHSCFEALVGKLTF